MASKFEIVTTRMGALSIRDNVSQEIMHNPVGPWEEANSLYIDQSQLRRRLGHSIDEELVLFDVGLGAGANALAALHCARSLNERRPFRIVSFERDLELLQFALENAHHFPHFHGFEDAVRSILEMGGWEEPGIRWELRLGDFVERIESEPEAAHIVFYDPYSFKKNREMWNENVFRKIRIKCRPDGLLYTYSRATPIRVSLLLAGFYVGHGVASGSKDETTQASLQLGALDQPLGQAWFGKWKRSRHPNAAGARDEDFPAIQSFIIGHPQFHQ